MLNIKTWRDKPTISTKMNTLRNIKWMRQPAFKIDRNRQNKEKGK
jgi:hypothetical protein